MKFANLRSGLSMVELLVALSIALTIAVVGIQLFPTVANKARASEAQRTLELAIITQTTHASSNEGFATESSELLDLTIARGVTFQTGSSGDNDVVSVTPFGDGGVALAVFVSEGSCLGVILLDPFTDGEVSSIVTFNGVCSAESVPSLL